MDALMPDNSTDLPDDQADTGGAGDGEGGDDMAADVASTPAIQMDSKQMADAGISGANPGDTFTLKFTVTSTDEGLTGTVLPMSAVKDKALGMMPKGKQAVKGPADMGFGDDAGFQGLDEAPATV